MLLDRSTNNLNMKRLIEDIVDMMSQVEVNISHCYREANQVADMLAKNAATSGITAFFFSFQQLPENVKGPFQLDKWQLHRFRTRYDKANFFVS